MADYGSILKFSRPKFWKMCSVCRTASSDFNICYYSVPLALLIHYWCTPQSRGLICTHIFYSIHPRYVSKLNIIWSNELRCNPQVSCGDWVGFSVPVGQMLAQSRTGWRDWEQPRTVQKHVCKLQELNVPTQKMFKSNVRLEKSGWKTNSSLWPALKPTKKLWISPLMFVNRGLL